MPFSDQLQAARKASRYARIGDFVRTIGMARMQYWNYEQGRCLPTLDVLERILLPHPQGTRDALVAAWRKDKALRAGIPIPNNEVDVDRVIAQMSDELTIILRKQSVDLSDARAKIVRTFTKRAEAILRAELET